MHSVVGLNGQSKALSACNHIVRVVTSVVNTFCVKKQMLCAMRSSLNKWNILGRTNCLLSFHYNLSSWQTSRRKKELWFVCVMKSIKQYTSWGCNVGITDGIICEVHHRDSHIWHFIRTRFNENWIRHSSKIRIITSTVWKVPMLVLLMAFM
jgi:hypothetical protein